MFEKLLNGVVLLMFDQLAPSSSEDCHRIMVPVCPFNITLPLFELAHTVSVVPVATPPAESGLTVMVAVVAIADRQVPFVTDALYRVVFVRFK